jgi:hypothetical protein
VVAGRDRCPLLFAVASFTVLGLSIGVMFELARRLVDGLPILVALQLTPAEYSQFFSSFTTDGDLVCNAACLQQVVIEQ